MSEAASVVRDAETASPWPHRLALLTAGATLLLILAGGVVTSTGSGLAVPDWPTTFGYNMFLFPLAKMTGGILYEHAHRLIGSVVGILTLALAVVVWTMERRTWLRWLGALALVGVIVQGVLGGLRVVLLADSLAFVHGVVAQAFFGLTGSLVLVTSPGWRSRVAPPPADVLPALRPWSRLTLAVMYAQIVLGALVTHTGSRVDAHLGLAALVSVLVLLVTQRVLASAKEWGELVRPAQALRTLWVLQLLLGLGSYATRFHGADLAMPAILGLAFPVAHRLAAALMLAAAVVLILQVYRLGGLGRPVQADRRVPGRVPA